MQLNYRENPITTHETLNFEMKSICAWAQKEGKGYDYMTVCLIIPDPPETEKKWYFFPLDSLCCLVRKYRGLMKTDS